MTDEDRVIIDKNLRLLALGKGPLFKAGGKGNARGNNATNIINGRRSSTAGVQAHQADDFNEQVKEAGITGVEYCRKTGDMLVVSERAKQKELRRRQLYAKDSVFSPRNL